MLGTAGQGESIHIPLRLYGLFGDDDGDHDHASRDDDGGYHLHCDRPGCKKIYTDCLVDEYSILAAGAASWRRRTK